VAETQFESGYCAGSPRIWRCRDEAGTLSALKRHRETVFDPAVVANNGRIVKLIQAKRGDGCVVLISASPVSASHPSRRLSCNVPAASHTYATSARRIIRTAHSIRALPSSNERQVSGARIRPSSGSPSWMQSWPNARELLRQQGKRPFGVLVQDVIVRWPPWSPRREGPVQRDRWRKTTTETISV
jgi:hypothetical protein